MSSEIRPEDIEAAIAAAEQRRRARMGGAAMGGGADVATAPAPAARRPVMPERVAGAAAHTEPPLRESAKAAASARTSEDLDDSWLDQPAKPRPAMTRRVADLPESEVVWEPETGRRGLALPVGIASVALLVFGSILWWAYSSDAEHEGGDVPTIVAEDTPIKEKPAEEGGLEVPDQDKLVYNSIAEGEEGATNVEQLLPGPEEPVTPPQPEVAATVAAGAAQPAPLLPPTEDDTDAALADAAPAPAAPAVAEPVQTAAAPAPAAPAIPATQEPAAPAATQQAAAAPAAAAPVASPEPAAGSSWKIQLAAVKSEAGARQEWGRMQKAHPDLLGDMRLSVQKADLGTKGIYVRIQAGPLPDRTTAEDVCAELKASKQPCLVVKP
jgi:hypothetical protein